MPFFFALLPLIIILVLRAKAKQTEAQTPPARTREQTVESERTDRPVTRPVTREAERPAARQAQTAVFVSPEGTASDEGECVEENPQHCAVAHPAETDESFDGALSMPRGDLARAVIMSEILGKPVSLRGDRFL